MLAPLSSWELSLPNANVSLQVPVGSGFCDLPPCPRPGPGGGQLEDLGSASSHPAAQLPSRFRAWAAGMRCCSHGAAWLSLRLPVLGE